MIKINNLEKKLVVGLLYRSQTTIKKMRRCKNYSQQLHSSGGGSYDQEGEGIKIGKWVEICEGYSTQAQIIYDGEYKNGKKVARWNIKHRNCADASFVEIQEFLIQTICLSGGGAYDEQGIKFGTGRKFVMNLKIPLKLSRMANMKMGKKRDLGNQLHIIQYFNGFGCYEQKNGIKNGIWTDTLGDFGMKHKLFMRANIILVKRLAYGQKRREQRRCGWFQKFTRNSLR